MTYQAEYALLAENLTARGFDLAQIEAALKAQKIETPSWAYANAGTRFNVFRWPGAARTLEEKLDDAALVHRLTGVAPAVAIHMIWDRPPDGDFAAVRQQVEARGLTVGSLNPHLFQQDEYRLGTLGHPSPATRELAVDFMIEACEQMPVVGSELLSCWFADGSNYAGQDSLRERKRRFEAGLATVYAHLPPHSRMLIEYKFFEPAFYSTDLPDWGTAYAWCLKLGPQAQVLMDLGHHAHGVNIEQIAAFLLDEGRLGGFHFNNRKYADDDLIVGSINPYELFLLYHELTLAEQGSEEPARSTARQVAYMIDQSHNIEGKLAPMVLSVLNCQEAYAKALLVPHAALAVAQAAGEVLLGHHLLTAAYQTDVRPLLAHVREALGVPPDPLAAYWASGYEQRIAGQRGQ